MKKLFTISLLSAVQSLIAQPVSKVWVADNGDGTYRNPIIHADYSDPDAIRVGDDYFMISSSFNHVPGLPILHSKDLVNWKLIGHALKKLPSPHFDTVRHVAAVCGRPVSGITTMNFIFITPILILGFISSNQKISLGHGVSQYWYKPVKD